MFGFMWYDSFHIFCIISVSVEDFISIFFLTNSFFFVITSSLCLCCLHLMLVLTSASSWTYIYKKKNLFRGGHCRVCSFSCTSCCHHSVHEFTNKVLKPAGLILFADSVVRPCLFVTIKISSYRLCAFSSHPVTHSALPPLFIDITHFSITPLLSIYCHLVYEKNVKITTTRSSVVSFCVSVRVVSTDPFCCFSQRRVMWKCTWRVVPSPCSCPKSRWTATAWKPGVSCPATSSNWIGCILRMHLLFDF